MYLVLIELCIEQHFSCRAILISHLSHSSENVAHLQNAVVDRRTLAISLLSRILLPTAQRDTHGDPATMRKLRVFLERTTQKSRRLRSWRLLYQVFGGSKHK